MSRADYEKRFAAALHSIATSETLDELRVRFPEYGESYLAALEYVYENARLEAEIALRGYPVLGRGDGDRTPSENGQPGDHKSSDVSARLTGASET